MFRPEDPKEVKSKVTRDGVKEGEKGNITGLIPNTHTVEFVSKKNVKVFLDTTEVDTNV